MRFKRDMYLRGEIVRAGQHVHITIECYNAVKAWVLKKTLKNYAMVCINCFNSHGILWIPYKFFKVMKHTYFDGFYKTIASNEIDDEL